MTPLELADVRLSSDVLEVVLRPARGCDVVSVVDRATGCELMFRSPWAGQAPVAAAWDDRSRWLSGYPGGWQVLCPNAGPARELDGALQGFHGEAAVVPWRVLEVDGAGLSACVDLFSAPVRLHRTVRVAGPVVQVEDTVENLGSTARSVAWVQHIGLGAALVEDGARLHLPACTVLADPSAPGTVLAPDSRHRWPRAHAADGTEVDLGPIPGGPREIFAALDGFDDGWCAITNEARGVGVAVHWDSSCFPYAWLWQELQATQGFPWFGRARVLGIEPANVLPDHGRSRPPAPVLAAGGRWATMVELSVFRPRGAVTRVGSGGNVVLGVPDDDPES
jgi:hypothetical protein